MSITSELYGHLHEMNDTNVNTGKISYRLCLVASLGSTTHKAKNIFKTIYPGLIAQEKTTPTEDAPLATFQTSLKERLVTTMVSTFYFEPRTHAQLSSRSIRRCNDGVLIVVHVPTYIYFPQL